MVKSKQTADYQRVRPTRAKKACFAAGTLVHTKEGLRPIETIQVGDYVLSKPESGEGEVAYKRVTKAFETKDQELYGVVYYQAKIGGHLIVTTAEHPFWVPSINVDDPNQRFGSMEKPYQQWVPVKEMFQHRNEWFRSGGKGERIGYRVATIDGQEYGVTAAPICVAITRKSRRYTHDFAGPEFGVLWPDGGRPFDGVMEGSRIDFRVSPPHYYPNSTLGLDKKGRNTDKSSWVEGSVEYYTKGYQPKRGTVYNLEVEDYHTYFVGEHGIWVHNTCSE